MSRTRRLKIFFLMMLLAGVVTLLKSCLDSSDHATLFTLLPAEKTGINFSNQVSYNEEFNPYTFRNFFNGGGVAIGDVNNDQLPDIYFCSNQGSNKLFLNKGAFQFEDVTEKTGLVSDSVWSTGVTMADVNADGWLDIYVCKSGDINSKNRNNELYINNGPSKNNQVSFSKKAREYGLDVRGLSTHAAFFDYDNDGDLDCYLLTNSFRSVGNYDLIKDQRLTHDSLGGNKLFRNDQTISEDGKAGIHFVDVTEQAGIYNSIIGFGLGVTISDINDDGWQDIYVSNDFFERDYLYINNHDGSFRETIEKTVPELSMNSMGADIADVNNDARPEIYVTDMFPEEEARVKTKTNFENWDKYQSNIANGYYKQFVRNSLQLNNGPAPISAGNYNSSISSTPGTSGHGPDVEEGWGDVTFSEVGRFSGVQATDWSWGALITDLDNDGWKDIFVANGIYKDITDQDYIQYTTGAYADIRQQILNKEKNIITRLVDLIPSHPISNYAFWNNGDLSFKDKAREWGLDEPSFSNGSAYGDLDNDGDLDLVVNNVNMPCFVYRNEARQQHPDNSYLKVSLEGEGKNRFGLGARVTVYYNGTLAYQEQMPMRGFESSVDPRLNFGLGRCKQIDSVVVRWPDGKKSVVKNITPNQHLSIKQREASIQSTLDGQRPTVNTLFAEAANSYGLDFTHKENAFVDFDRDKLIFHMLSTQGPRMAKGDINGDGLEDLYICGASGQPGVLYEQTKQGGFTSTNEALLQTDALSEDTDAVFFDCDSDGDQDLYVCSGGNEFSPNSTALIDRLYINDGRGVFSKSPQVLPSYIFESSSCARPADYDRDGDLDLFVGVRLKPFQYGYPCKGYILENNGKGVFTDVTQRVSPELLKAGMVTDARWLDWDRDGFEDLLMAGEYMPLRLWHNQGGKGLKEVTGKAGLGKTNGWWNRLELWDVNGDGHQDIIAAGHGLNSRFKATGEKPVSMYVSDFDGNGSVEQVVSCYNGESAYPMALRHDLVGVLPYLKKKYLKYEDYKEQRVEDIFTAEQLKQAQRLDAYELRSAVFLSDGRGGYSIKPLPTEAQLSVMYGIAVEDVDQDGIKDIVMGGNFYESKPEAGIYDGSYGAVLKGDGRGGFTALAPTRSGVMIKGAVRDICFVKTKNKTLMVIAKNNQQVEVKEKRKNS